MKWCVRYSREKDERIIEIKMRARARRGFSPLRFPRERVSDPIGFLGLGGTRSLGPRRTPEKQSETNKEREKAPLSARTRLTHAPRALLTRLLLLLYSYIYRCVSLGPGPRIWPFAGERKRSASLSLIRCLFFPIIERLLFPFMRDNFIFPQVASLSLPIEPNFLFTPESGYTRGSDVCVCVYKPTSPSHLRYISDVEREECDKWWGVRNLSR